MKRIVCLLLVFVLAFSFTACSKKKDKKQENSVDIEYFAKLGQIPECEYSLGDDVEKVKSELSAAAEKDEGKMYDFQEGEKTAFIFDGKHNYYYVKERADKGLAYIATYDKAYGFEIGEISITVKNALGDIKYTEEPLSQDNAFFVFGAQNGSVIKCEFGNKTVMFVFDDNALCATAVYLTEDMKFF